MKKKNRLMIMDAGERRDDVKLYDDASDTIKVLTKEEYIQLPLQDEYCGIRHSDFENVWLSTEQAHIVPSKMISLAQVFKLMELEQLKKNCEKSNNFILSAFSEKLTPRALHYSGNKYGKGNKDNDDTFAIAKLIADFNQYDSLKKVKSFDKSDRTAKCAKWREDVANPEMNAAQAWNYGLIKKGESRLDLDLCPVVRDRIIPNIHKIALLSEDVKFFFSLDSVKENRLLSSYPHIRTDITNCRDVIRVTKKKNGPVEYEVSDWAFEMRGLYAVANAIFDYNGDFRIDPITNCRVGNNFLNEAYYVNSQFHQKGGVSRAVLYNYVMPIRIGDMWDQLNTDVKWPRYTNSSYNRGDLTFEQDKFFILGRKRFKKSYNDIMTFLRTL